MSTRTATTTTSAPADQAWSPSVLRRVLLIAGLELRKVLVTRGSALLLGITLGVGVLIAVGALVLSAQVDTGRTQVSVPLLTLAVALAVGAPLIGVLIMTSDWQSREAMTVFLLEPRRGLVFLGKLVASVTLSLVLTAVVGLVAVVLAVLVSLITGAELAWDSAPGALGLLLVVSVTGALSGSALAAMIMNTPIALIVVILQPLVIDTALGFVPVVGPYLRAGALSDFLVAEGAPLTALSGLAIWIAVPLLIGWRRWAQREVR